MSLEQQSGSFDILWFKLTDSSRFEAENIFYSIVRDRNAFGLFRSTSGNLQIGWALHEDAPMDWKQADWSLVLAKASPPWLAEYIRTHAESIEQPVLLSVVVGRCPRWYAPGLLLLGDAVHIMSG